MKRRLPSLTALRDFEAVARNLSFTRAAEELCVTQAAVSHQVKALEDHLKIRLFTRSARGVELTEGGRALYEVTRDAFDRIAFTARQLGDAHRSGRRTLSIRTTPFFSTHWLVPRIPHFSTRHPDIDVRLFHGQAPVEVDNSGYEIIVFYGNGEWPGYTCYPLFGADLVPLCSPRLAPRSNDYLDPGYLASQVLICETAHDWWTEWLHKAGAASIVPERRLHLDDPNVVVEAGLSGQGFILAPPTLLRAHLEADRLTAPFDPSFAIDIDYFLIHQPDALRNRSVVAFRDWLLEEVANYVRLAPGPASRAG